MVSAYRCVITTRSADIEPHLAAWNELMPRALEDNFYLSPSFVVATLRHLVAPGKFIVVFVYRCDAAAERLVAVAPFSVRRPSVRIPLTTLSGLTSPHGYLSHPLVDREDTGDSLEALWQWLERPEHPWQLIFFHGVSSTSPFLPVLERSLKQHQRLFLSKRMFMRPMLYRHENFEAYLSALPSARRKHYKRRWRQLENMGTVEVMLHRTLDVADDLAERFMQLEQRGWKGQQGTALVCDPAGAAFFREMVQVCGRDGKLFFVEIKFNGRTIAMTTNFVCGQVLFAFKIAYDPDFADFSPGILAEVQTARLFHETPELVKGEGGATGASYLSSYWRDITEMRAMYIALPGWRARRYLSLLALVWRAKEIFHRFTARISRLICFKLCSSEFPIINEVFQSFSVLA